MLESQRNFVRLKNFGAFNRPDGYGKAQNHCGETMEVFLRVRNGRVIEALFFTDGCLHTIQAGSAVTELAQGRALRECMAISGKRVLENIGDFPPIMDIAFARPCRL
jgi:nitrogen fixation NifU-like protein